MTIDEMRAKKAEYGWTNEEICERSLVPLGTVQKIFGGATSSPRRQTIEALERIFMEEAQRRYNFEMALPPGISPVLRERAIEYGAGSVGPYTIDDYYALPDDRRVELIDGKFYDMAAPSIVHQFVLGELYMLFRRCIELHDTGCEVFMAPCDVCIDDDKYTIVQPDLLVVCEYDHTETQFFHGGPDLVLEILSPSTRFKDQTLKLDKYQQAGVREYWIVDIENRQVTVHYFMGENYKPVIYELGDDIPVYISDGKCRIDLSGLNDMLDQHGW